VMATDMSIWSPMSYGQQNPKWHERQLGNVCSMQSAKEVCNRPFDPLPLARCVYKQYTTPLSLLSAANAPEVTPGALFNI
jgi:hypothetical protein